MDNTHRGEKKIQAVEPRVCISCQRGHSEKPVFWQFVTALAHGASAYLKVLLCSVCFGYFRLFLIMNVGLFPKLILVANSKSTLESCKEKFRITLGFPIRHQYQFVEEPKFGPTWHSQRRPPSHDPSRYNSAPTESRHSVPEGPHC